MIRICFVCLGNICRSPTAGAIMQRLVQDVGLEDLIEVESAGTGGWHVGELADPRTREEASRRGIEMTSRAQQFKGKDFVRFNYILAMDKSNRDVLVSMAPDDAARDKVHLLRKFEDPKLDGHEVPDPYYGGDQGFADVFAMCERACRGLLAHLRKTHQL